MWTEFEMGGYRMTYEEAKKYAKENILAYTSEMAEFEKTAIKALEKQIPMAAATRTIFNDYLQAWERIRVCPVCRVDTPVPRALETWEWWCPDCGQRLDWGKPKGDSYDFAIIDEVVAYDTQKED